MVTVNTMKFQQHALIVSENIQCFGVQYDKWDVGEGGMALIKWFSYTKSIRYRHASSFNSLIYTMFIIYIKLEIFCNKKYSEIKAVYMH